MRLKTLRLQNFRGIRDVTLDLGPERTRTTVLAGINGAGKSSLLDGAAMLLRLLVNDLMHRQTDPAALIAPSDLMVEAPDMRAAITVQWAGEEMVWSVRASRARQHWRRGALDTVLNAEGLESLVRRIEETAAAPPLVAYYRVNRSVESALPGACSSRAEEDFDPWEAYGSGPVFGSSDFQSFFQWFRLREDLENEERLRSPEAFDHRDPALQAVRRAVESFLPGYRNLRIARRSQTMVLSKDGMTGELDVTRLSNGERSLLALAGDIARRLAMLNEGAADPLHGSGVVLIDEIELHLHPRWQRTVIANLEAAFPNLQFIVSTHSPQVLGQVAAESVLLLLNDPETGTVQPFAAQFAYGRDSNAILETLMDGAARDSRAEADIAALFRAIDEGDSARAQILRAELASRIGEDEPKLAEADVYLHLMDSDGSPDEEE
ncbi:MAG: AAA family ATPase [Sumerlaeia bacterium]